MLYPEGELEDWERQSTAQRILTAAEFIKRGATISAVGTLVLGDMQAEYMGLRVNNPIFDPEFINDTPVAPSPKEDWLNTSVVKALEPQYPTLKAMPQPLRGLGNMSVRSILVLGRDRVCAPRTLGIGKTSATVLDEFFAGNPFDFEWKEQPTPEDAAHICQRLRQVTSRVLPFSMLRGKPSVLHVVRTSLEEREALWLDTNRNHRGEPRYLADSELDELCNAPEVYALRFEVERIKQRDTSYLFS